MLLKKFVQEHKLELEMLLDYIKVGVFIADENGNVLLLNNESEKTGGMSKQELVGRNMVDLIEEGYVEESTVIKAMENKHENCIIQKLREGGQIFITGVPVMKDEMGEDIDIVICTERDITETMELRELLAENVEMAVKYKKELESLRGEQRRIEDGIVIESHAMRSVVERAARIAKTDTTTLLTGESGTGKELIAKLIYKNSRRNEKPFFRINCAAIPENLLESEFFGYEKGAFTGANKEGKVGYFEMADGGTLFLDEVGDLPIAMQAKLLRVLQEKEVMRVGGAKVIPIDVRIIAATNKNLEEAIQRGDFREDLYYRLNIFPIELPELRSRKEDIPALVNYFLNYFNREYSLTKTLEKASYKELMNYDWPGNVRELRNVMERVVLDTDDKTISRFQIMRQLAHKKHACAAIEGECAGSLKQIVEDYEKNIIMSLMNKYGNASKVAHVLGVNKSTISKKLKRYAGVCD